jgi:hypothetical protein
VIVNTFVFLVIVAVFDIGQKIILDVLTGSWKKQRNSAIISCSVLTQK